jgi:hypothetical protein
MKQNILTGLVILLSGLLLWTASGWREESQHYKVKWFQYVVETETDDDGTYYYHLYDNEGNKMAVTTSEGLDNFMYQTNQ